MPYDVSRHSGRVMCLMITGLEQAPFIRNTGVRVTEENQQRVYRTLKYMVKNLRFIIRILVLGDLIF